jgi:hypothetical protein
VWTRLIALEAAGVNSTEAGPASLLRVSAEQAVELTYVEFLFPPTEGGMIWRSVEIKFPMDGSGVIEPGFGLAEAFVKFRIQENQRDLNTLGESAVAVRRSGFVRIINVLLGKILTLSYVRPF